MAEAIENPGELTGETVHDQMGGKLGEVKALYCVGEESEPMWALVESPTGLVGRRDVFIPLARLKLESGELRVPYSLQHVQESPEVDAGDELSEEDDRELRDFYAIDLADGEVRNDTDSYAAQVPDAEGTARRSS